ncbi:MULTISPECIES: DUF4469 domain-containing protein [Parabacteroides]|nr:MULTISPECIES: DUF4469 domain-containing protein [Parabacteroides]KAI4361181.1 hypothetical protein C825_003244 [Parabacteroides sp. ASF519]NDO65818.1 DUF4469 domain-containing protein [Parabacteroides goldsteinii]
MASIGQKLETKGVIMTLLSLVLISTGCEDKIDSPTVNPSEGKTVEVTLNLGIADEEDGAGATASPTSKAGSNSRSALEAVPVYGMQTKSGTDIPDKLYNLEIWQYDGSGKQIGGKALGNVTVGSTFTASLKQATGCKLLLVARGASADFESLSGKTLSEVQNMTVKAKESNINAIAPNAIGNSLANMTYYLYLENVNITSAGKIESPAGQDVRLLLKRLATKVELNWTFASDMTQKGYTLKEVKLCQVPAHYRLTGTELDNANSAKTVWIPANARGISSYSNSPYYRNKTNANPAATYAEFVVDNSEKKERLYYRVYLGGNETDDFNLLENTNYHWTVNINKADYVNDPRIQLLDQTPVKSTNEQPTSNCFMMLPGTNICFNPYKHEAGVNGWNTELTTDGSIKDGKEIKKVKILWQNKDAGTSGELVMGYPISESDHSNLVKLTNGDIAKDARIHLKVPVTNGGNALIAAYGTDDKIALWSWHIWVSDYVPALLGSFTAGDATSRTKAIEAAQNTTRGGIVHTYQGASWTQESGAFYKKVIMDRNLGAFENSDAQFDPAIHKLTFDIVPTKKLRDALKNVKVINMGTKADVARIRLVTDTLTGLFDGSITASEDIMITGNNIKITGDEAVVGVFFVAGDGTTTKVTRRLTQNDPSKVIARVPALANGSYTLRIVTQFSQSSTTLKEARTLEYPTKLVVGDSGSGDRPEIE